jgi:hypothetical protein
VSPMKGERDENAFKISRLKELVVGRAAMDQVWHPLGNSQSRMPSCQSSGGVSAFARSRPAQPRIDRYHLCDACAKIPSLPDHNTDTACRLEVDADS